MAPLMFKDQLMSLSTGAGNSELTLIVGNWDCRTK